MITLAVIAMVFLVDALNGPDKKTAEPATVDTIAESTTKSEAAASNDLPRLPLTTLDSTRLMANDLEGSTVLVLFQPDCDHCQREATQIREHIAAFGGYKIYFVSDAGLPQLSQFAEAYNLADQSNVYFAQTTINDILSQVGPIEAPSLFVYSEEGRLVKSFIGETPIEEILKVL